jgi:hypothetical protein
MDALPADKVVPYGEPFEIECGLGFHSFWRPTQAFCQYGHQPSLRATVRGSRVVFHIPGQTQKDVLRLRAGDIEREILVTPTYRPELRQLEAQIQRPEYLHYPVATEKVATGSLAVLEGSSVVFHGKASRALASVSMAVERSSAEPLSVKDSEFTSPLLNLAGVSRCEFAWVDTLGLNGSAPLTLALRTEKDLPPATECRDLALATAMLENEVLDIKIAATDDYGVRETGVAWESQKRKGNAAPGPTQRFKIKDGGFQDKEVAGSYSFCPSVLRIPAGSLVTLRATAVDYYPGRSLSESVSYQIFILDSEEHARLIQKRFESLLSRIEELARKQEELQNASREVQQMPPEKMNSEATGSQLSEQSAEEKRNAEELDQLANEWAEALREALRNPELTEESLREWAQHLQAMKSLSQKEMQQAIQALKSAQQKMDGRKPDVDRAVELEQSILKALQEMLKNMGAGLDRMQAQSLSRRLQKLSQTEKDMKGRLQKISTSNAVGLRPQDLTEKERQAVATIVSDNEDVRKEAQTLQEEISRFFERTRMSNYGEVSKDMEAARPEETIGKLSETIRQNQANEAIPQTEAWSQRFKQWGQKLEAEGEKLPSGGGNSSGELSPEEMQQLMKMIENFLKLARLRQEEEGLRERTRLTEQHKADNPNYRQDSENLAQQQQRLSEEIQKLLQDPIMAPAGRKLKEIDQAMGDAEKLLKKPQTDQATVSAETAVIELLTNLMNSMQQNGSMAGMRILIPIAGMGGSGGGSTSGGDTDRTNLRPEGNPDGKTPEERRMERMSGRQGMVLPMEFRDALEGYFNAVDQTAP